MPATAGLVAKEASSLKNQPSNPLAQLLRGGIDAAPNHLAEARAALLNPEWRSKTDEFLSAQRRQSALLEFQKFLDFALADKVLTKEAETNLSKLGRALGLDAGDMAGSIEHNLEQAGATREIDELPAPPPAFIPPQAVGQTDDRSNAPPTRQSSPRETYRRMLQLSKLDAASITLEHRDTLGDMAEKLGLEPADAEDMVEAYLGAMSRRPPATDSASSCSPRQVH